MTGKFTRNWFTWIAYILLAFYSYFLNILGPITPFLHDELQISYTVSSLHFSAFAAGIILVGLLGHALIDRIGRRQALSIGAIGLGVGALLLVSGRSPAVTVSATFLMGCVGSLILAVVPAALAEEHGELRAVAISEANVLASLISAAAPFLVGWLVNRLIGWRMALVSAALLSILVGATLIRPGQPRFIQPKGKQPGRALPPQFWFYWITLVLAVSIEFCMIFWSADYLVSELNLAPATAAQSVSLFLAGMVLGRLVGSRVLRLLSPRTVVLASILVGMLGFAFYWTAASPWVGMLSLGITGFGVASLYPLVLSMAIGAASGGESLAGARTTLASGTAILLLPLVLGRLADLAGIKTAYTLVAALFIGMVLMMTMFGISPKGVPAEQIL